MLTIKQITENTDLIIKGLEKSISKTLKKLLQKLSN